MTEKEAILKRHSVRSYEDKKIEDEKVKLIEEKIKELNAEGNLNLQFIIDRGRERKSKTFEQVTAGKKDAPDWFKEGVKMALLAPTAINQQKFTIKLNDDESVEFIDNGGVLSRVDLGIVKCHFEIGAGKKF
ncbi:MAG: hypothetical protein IK121_06145 [Lachnospiraceae bacterium]|nr:hypothetical protein [Lachnospiraceae bacterium]